jgi:superfamily II DNA or RNA helicase
MSNVIHIHLISESQIQLKGNPGLIIEAQDFFTFRAHNAHFDPRVRNKIWDGNIRLINRLTGVTYRGLIPHIQKFADDRGYSVKIQPETFLEEISLKEAQDFANKFDLKNGEGEKIIPDADQIRAFAKAIRYKRRVLVFPTGGGKSLIAFLILNWLKEHDLSKKVCVIVPTTMLVDQLAMDFKDYGWNTDEMVHRIYSGLSKDTKDIFCTITTWQSAIKQDINWLAQFDTVIGDEAHECSAKSLIHLLTSMKNAKFRIGMTGSFDNEKINKLVIEGLFGPTIIISTAKKKQDEGRLAPIRIKAIVLRYPEKIIKAYPKKFDYNKEIQFLVGYEPRNKFIINLALSLKGNTMIMFNLIEKHGDILYEMIETKKDKERPLFYVHGSVDTDDRTKYRRQIEKETNSLFIASYGTFQRGANIRNLHNIILASGFKSVIRNKQTIGRGLRLGSTKSSLSVYDIADDLRTYNEISNTYGKNNYSLDHFLERISLYEKEEFPYQVYNVQLKGK